MKHSRGSLNSGNRPKSYNWCIMGAYCWSILYQNGKPFQFGNANKWKIPTWNANEKNQSFLLIENMCGFFDVSNIAGCQLACLWSNPDSGCQFFFSPSSVTHVASLGSEFVPGVLPGVTWVGQDIAFYDAGASGVEGSAKKKGVVENLLSATARWKDAPLKQGRGWRLANPSYLIPWSTNSLRLATAKAIDQR